MIQVVMILVGALVFSIPVMISAGITLHDARRQRTVDMDAKLLRAAPKQFQQLVCLETIRTAALAVGGVAWGLAVILLVVFLLTRQEAYLRMDVILAVVGFLLFLTGCVLARRAKKLRHALEQRYSLGKTEKLGLWDVVEQIPGELQESMGAEVRRREDHLQAMDMLLRRDR